VHERQQQVQAGQVERPAEATFAHVVTHYLAFKAAKHSLANDRQILEKQLLPAFGAGLPIRQLTTQLIAAYEERRTAELSCRKTTVSDWTLRNELAVLRHLLRLAHRRYSYLDRVPDIDMPKAPKGRTRFLNEEELERLLAACASSKNPHLSAIVVLAVNTGKRKSEILNLKWEHVNLDKDFGFNAGVTLYDTKNGEDRGVPLNTAAIAALQSVEPDPENRTGPGV